MKFLFLIRHAKSSWDNPTLRDFQRPLRQRGLETAPKMAMVIHKEKVKPDLLVSSPARRAIDTARFFGIVFGISEQEFRIEADIYEASPATLQRVISNIPEEAHTVFMFGHNPGFTDVANLYTEDFIENIPTCGIVRIDSTAESWREFYEENAKVTARWFPKEKL